MHRERAIYVFTYPHATHVSKFLVQRSSIDLAKKKLLVYYLIYDIHVNTYILASVYMQIRTNFLLIFYIFID